MAQCVTGVGCVSNRAMAKLGPYGWAVGATDETCTDVCGDGNVHVDSMAALITQSKFEFALSEALGPGETCGYFSGSPAGVSFTPAFDDTTCYYPAVTPDADASDSTARRVCCCVPTGCPDEPTTTTTTTTTTLAHLGWIIAPKTKSCSAACADQASI